MPNISNYFQNNDDLKDLIDLFTETSKDRSEWILILYVVLMSVVFVVGITGNLIICYVIYCDKKMHTATNYYLFNLSVSDLVVSFGILLHLWHYLKFDSGRNIHNSKESGNMICKLESFLILSLWNNGILTLTVLAIERYIAIWHPLLLSAKASWRRTMMIIASIWVIAILEAIPEFWTTMLVEVHNREVCFVIPSSFTKMSNGILSLLTFVIPLCIMVFVYTMIAFKVNFTHRCNSGDNVFNQRANKSKVKKLTGKWNERALSKLIVPMDDSMNRRIHIHKTIVSLLFVANAQGQ